MQGHHRIGHARAAARRCALFLALLPWLHAHAGEADGVARFDIPQQQLQGALTEYARQSGRQLLYAPQLARGRTAHAVQGEKTAAQALDELLAGTGLVYATNAAGAVLISEHEGATTPATDTGGGQQGNVSEAAAVLPAAASQDTGAPPPAMGDRPVDPQARTFDTIVVTAQKKAENIQKVPIAISAFSGQSLSDRKIETGGDLVTATPNVSFTKTNFASYNFQIRGIGTQALSVTTDPAVAISFNSTPMIRNRLFEQEYFDVDRVEVLRGPQGTLYGRNATAGVVNMIPNLADPDAFDANVLAEVGSYDTRRVNGMLNVPLSDTFAFRVATQYTKRDGYDHNTVTGKDVNDRDLLSTRVSATFRPSDRFTSSLVWEHFQEDDQRARTGKQLCHNDPGPSSVGDLALRPGDGAFLSQGCKDGSLYDDGAFGVPNGASLPFVLGAASAGGIVGLDGTTYATVTLIPKGVDPYAGVTQSHDLRTIATDYDPRFKASNDVVQLNFDVGVSDRLKFVSQTLYTRDRYYSTQDYGRFRSNPVFTDTSSGVIGFPPPDYIQTPAYDFAPGGVICDPQLGCSNRMEMVDLVDSDSTQWSQEFRLQSSFDGRFNFSVGANYLDYKVDESYYVFSNLFTAITELFLDSAGTGAGPVGCTAGTAVQEGGPNAGGPCAYIDPNALGAIDGQGHNYFRSRNLARTKSAAIFGEGYWNLTDTLRLTAGLRFTRDEKVTTPVPSQLILAAVAPGYGLGAGYVGYGYPKLPDIRQTWNVPTGRLVLDWSPDLPFTDSTMFYASASRGYKAGGTNSPGIGADPSILSFEQRDPRFKAEHVNAFELGMKNVIAGGKFVLNATAFYNDYKDYQVSQIVDRATLNENFDARTWGGELEAIWRPTDHFQLSGNVGLLHTRIGDNQYSIDVMDRTAGNPDWMVVKPWLQLASNCIAPKDLVELALKNFYAGNDASTYPTMLNSFCTVNTPLYPGGFTADDGNGFPGTWAYLLDGRYYNPETDAPNGGAGFAKNLGGHELPNAPHITVSLSPQYVFDLPESYLTLRGDLYYQGPSCARIYQDRIDRLHDWGNVNLSLTWSRPAQALDVQLYVKNVLGGHAITGTFLNSDDTGLTSNVFIQDPRIVGLSVRKGFF